MRTGSLWGCVGLRAFAGKDRMETNMEANAASRV